MGAREVGEILVPGVNAARALLLSDRVRPRRLLLREGEASPRIEEVAAAARQRGVPVRVVPREELDRLVPDARHQGVAVAIDEWPYREEGELPSAAPPPGPPPCYLILDHLQDVGNFGAILRSSHLLGVTGIVIPNARSAAVTAAAVRASAGAAVFIDVWQVPNLARVVARLKAAGVWVWGLDAAGERDIRETDLTLPLALVLGGEHQGVSRRLRGECDGMVRLPQTAAGSFNASVAAAMALYEVLRQRGVER